MRPGPIAHKTPANSSSEERATSRTMLRTVAGPLLAILITILVCASASFAQTDTWNNPPPTGFWSNGTNWSGGVPTSTSNVQIGSVSQTIPPTVTLDINSTVASLEIDGSGTKLVLTGDSVMNQAAAVNLTVTGATNLRFGNEIDIGGGASLTLNGTSNNQGTINLSTTTIIAGEAPDVGQLNGSGTLTNSGTISGNGSVAINVMNTPTGVLTGNLTLNGITVTGGGYVQGQLQSINSILDGVTLGGTVSSFPPTSNLVALTGGSVVTVQNEITNVGNLQLINTAGGVTINGTGSIRNQGFIFGAGIISTNIDNTGGQIQTAGAGSSLTLQGNISGDGTSSLMVLTPSTTLVLDGAQVSDNILQGNGGTVTAQNGASFKSGTIDGRNGAVNLSAGSVLDVSNSNLKGALQLNSATIDGMGTLSNNGTIQGNGTIGLNVQNTSTGALSGDFTVNGVTVTGGSYAQGNLTATNATFEGVNFGGTSGTVTLTGGSTLAIGAGSVGGTLVVGSGGVGATITQVPAGGELINNGVIEGGGTISANITNGEFMSAGRIIANDTTVPLVLQGFIDTEATNVNAAIISIGAHSSLVLDGAEVTGNTLQGNGGNLTAINGASFTGGVIDGTNDRVLLTSGSVLSVSGDTVKGTFELGNATLNGSSIGLDLAENSELHGGGTINTQIEGVGLGINGNGSIIADNTSAPLVLAGNVAGVASVSAVSGGTLTLANVTVTTGAASVGVGSTLNGSGRIQMSSVAAPFTNSGTVAPSGGAGGSGFLLINGFYTQTAGGAMDFTLGGGSNSVLVENVFAESIANFQAGSVIDASFFAGFDPSSGCAATFGVCETFDIFDTEALGALSGTATFSGFGNIAFNLPTLPAGFQWVTLDENNDEIDLVIDGMKSTSGGGGGNGTSMPEPSEWMMLAAGLCGLLAFKTFARRNRPSRRATA